MKQIVEDKYIIFVDETPGNGVCNAMKYDDSKNCIGCGLFSQSDDEILPCIFENLDNRQGHTPSVEYKGVRFKLYVRYYPQEPVRGLNDFLASFSFNGGVVTLDSKWDDAFVESKERVRNISKELFQELSLTHHRYTKEELEQLEDNHRLSIGKSEK